jgi:hypothetical protein
MTRIEYLKVAEQWAEAQKEELGIDGGPEAENIETWAVNIAEKISDGNSDAFDSADEFRAPLDSLADMDA